MGAKSALLLLAGATSVFGDICYEPGFDNTYEYTGLGGACTPAPILMCTDPQAYNFGAICARRPRPHARA